MKQEKKSESDSSDSSDDEKKKKPGFLSSLKPNIKPFWKGKTRSRSSSSHSDDEATTKPPIPKEKKDIVSHVLQHNSGT